MVLLALGTFVAGVHAEAWQICVVGLILALFVPAMAIVQRSSLFIMVALLGAIFIGGEPLHDLPLASPRVEQGRDGLDFHEPKESAPTYPGPARFLFEPRAATAGVSRETGAQAQRPSAFVRQAWAGSARRARRGSRRLSTCRRRCAAPCRRRPLRPSRTLSVVILRTSTKSAAPPGGTASATSFMNLSSMPKSVSAPETAPGRRAERRAGERHHEDQPDQRAPEHAGDAADRGGVEELVELDVAFRIFDGDDGVAHLDQIFLLHLKQFLSHFLGLLLRGKGNDEQIVHGESPLADRAKHAPQRRSSRFA